MQLRNLNVIMMLIAGIIVTIISIISKDSLNHLIYTLMIVLVIFFVIGTLIQTTLNHITQKADNDAREKEKEKLDLEAKNLAEGKESSTDDQS